jgi:oligopeptide transport system substrate-binding protein
LENTRPPFTDARVRRAFAMALNKRRYIQLVDLGYGLSAEGGFIPPGMAGYSRGIGLPFDPGQANKLLNEAGYADRSALPSLTCLTVTSRKTSAEFIRQDLRDNLDVELQVEVVPPADYYAHSMKTKPAIMMGGWCADYADPDNFLRVAVQLDLPDWHHLEYEQLLERTRVITDQAERMNLYARADRILMEEAVIVPVVYSRTHLLLKPWVRQYPIEAIKGPGFWKDVIMDPHP